MAIIPQTEYLTTLRADSESRVVPQSQVARSAFCGWTVILSESDPTRKKRAGSAGEINFL